MDSVAPDEPETRDRIIRKILLRGLLISLLSSATAACVPEGTSRAADAYGEPAAVGMEHLRQPDPSRPAEENTLAYEHNVSVELDRELIMSRMEDVQTACRQHRKSSCAILDVSLNNRDDIPDGTIRMRLAPADLETVLVIAAKGGRITKRSTHAEDLSAPVADTEREAALLSTHRDRLAAIIKDRQLMIDQLIAASRELSTVQARLDELATERANLRRRIDTELLSLHLHPPRRAYLDEQHPIRDALKSFGHDFTHAIGQIIRFIAVMLPWLVVIVPGIILLRLFWRRIGQWLTRRELRRTERK